MILYESLGENVNTKLAGFKMGYLMMTLALSVGVKFRGHFKANLEFLKGNPYF